MTVFMTDCELHSPAKRVWCRVKKSTTVLLEVLVILSCHDFLRRSEQLFGEFCRALTLVPMLGLNAFCAG